MSSQVTSPGRLAEGDTLVLDLFPGRIYRAHVDRTAVNVNGTWTVRGRIEGYPFGYVLISTTGGRSLGAIRIPERGEHYIIQSEPAAVIHHLIEPLADFPDEVQVGPPLIPPGPSVPEIAEMAKIQAEILESGPLDPAQIDVMIVYTPAARDWANTSGGGIANVIAQAMGRAQLGLDNSQTLLTMSLVHSGEVNYAESGSSNTDLDRLTFHDGYDPWNRDPDRYMEEVQTWRDQYGADLVALFAHVNDTGGLAWLLSSSAGRPHFGFSLIRVQQAATGYTHIHEMGHNMGCHHHKGQNVQPGPGLFSYSAGWRWIGTDSGRYCSIMTYTSGSYFPDGLTHTQVAHFSNPSILHWGVPTGHSADGDNARTIREVKHVVAAYRDKYGTPKIGLNRTRLNFGYEIGGTLPGAQQVIISNTGGGMLDWTAAANSWLGVTPTSGSETGVVSISVNPAGLSAGTYTSQVTFTAPGASNSPQAIQVTLNVYPQGSATAPFGVFDTPASGATVYGAIPVTGWALDEVQVQKIEIKRSPHPADPPEVIGPDGLVFISNAIFVEGARPDIETAYPQYPLNYRAGWGYMLLTNTLPNRGNATFTLHAFAHGREGTKVKLGQKTITGNNANAVLPFGTIDTPAQGAVISGSGYYNFGWALTPQPNMIPTDGSTIHVWVDGSRVGSPSYNHYRGDIATLFPSYANTNGAAGMLKLDTTAMANGVHTIAWGVVDNAGNGEGLGSRYFSVLNTGGAETTASSQEQSGSFGNGNQGVRLDRTALDGIPTNLTLPAYVTRGFDMTTQPDIVHPDLSGAVHIEIEEIERVELLFGALSGYLVVGDELRPLPIGSTLDPASGVFAWQPGPGFLGEYTFVFVRESAGGFKDKTLLRITIRPKFY